MLVRDYMGHKMVFFQPEDRVRRALRLFRLTNALGITLVDAGMRVTGILTRSPQQGSIPSAATLTVSPADTVGQLVAAVRRTPLGQAIVATSSGEVVGLLTQVDILNGLLDRNVFIQSELGAVLQSLPTGIVAVNEEGDISLANPAAERLLGLEPGSLTGMPASAVAGVVDLEAVRKAGLAASARRVRVGGRHLVVDAHPVAHGERILGAVAIIQDLTDIESIARELESVRKLHQTLETILELAYDGIVVCDQNGIVTMVNKALVDFLGVAKEDLVGSHVTDILENTRLHLVARSGVPEFGHVQMLRGQKLIVDRMPLVQDGRVVGAVGKIMFRGIGELKEIARRLESLETQLNYYKEELGRVSGARYTIDSIVHRSQAMAEAKRMAQQAARSTSTVLLLGESGTGKELFAHAIHNASPRRLGPFIRVNCAAVPEHLLESEFFGYADGAFTGARKGGKPGRFEMADGGTLFLDEIGDMSPQLQAKLLRVLQDREVERLGATRSIPLDVRIIAASNKDLEAMVRRGEFREDLYYRLNVISIHISPLRERPEEIVPLAQAFIEKFNAILGTQVRGLTPAAVARLVAYPWPGNVRELENTIERAMNLDPQEFIDVSHLPPGLARGLDPARPSARAAVADDGDAGAGLYRETVAEAERRAILSALEQSNGNKAAAARLLGLSRSRLYEKLQASGLGVGRPGGN